MKRLFIFLLPICTLGLVSCNTITPEVANAFKGEYWMETTNIGFIDGQEYPLNEKSTWTPVSIYEKSGKLYVQTELLGAPDFNNEHPKEVEGTKERPAFIAPYKIPAEDGDTESGIETVESDFMDRLVCRDGYIILISHGVMTQSLPIKAKSGSETVLNLESYKPVEVFLTSPTGEI